MQSIKKNLIKIIKRSFLAPQMSKLEKSEFKNKFDEFKKLTDKSDTRFNISWEDTLPMKKDNQSWHDFDRHYIYHTAWAARKIKEINPVVHTDISSSLYFCSIVSAFFPTKFYEFRRVPLELDYLTSEQANLLELPFRDSSVSSLSCMHVVEHIGLGRYGDPLNPDGDLLAIRELVRVLEPEGNLLFVVPVGQPKVQFNAHRIYSYNQVMDYFNNLKLVEFSLIPDNKNSPIIQNANPNIVKEQTYACGCFWFKKE